ncbi:helix-turn-helix domain-containing protein [Paenibacillus cymbidii]|uniref:helix-turn-helix domain-containing protein n=1 Tax=Paenibacillus cymbidii TaxID=1639034 RepID=UPI0010803305|nr:AraC family transcriptional regulator [Paenibacillus cymbidii]
MAQPTEQPAAAMPFFRFSLRYIMSPGEIHGPRTTYIQSFNLIESGTGTLHTDDGPLPLFPGVHAYVPSGKPHRWEASRDNPFIYRIVYFEWNYRERPGVVYPSDFLADRGSPVNASFIEPAVHEPLVEYTVLDDADAAEWNRLFAPILSNYDVYDAGRFPGSLRIQGQFLLFLDFVINTAMQPKTFADRRVKAFMQAAQAGEPELTHDNIEHRAERHGLSRSHFHDLFKRQTGTTPNAYWSEQRIKRTFRELIETTETITRIAERHRFESVHYYAKLFRKVVGLTPGEFRRRNRV